MRIRSRDGRILHAVPTGDAPAGAAPIETQRRPIGLILLEMGAISPEGYARVMAEQQRSGGLFGDVATRLGVVSPDTIRYAVERQQNFHVLRAGDNSVEPLVVAAFDPNDPLSKTVRELRGSVTAARRADGRSVRSVALLGIGTEVETTLLTANLAVAFAQAGYRTLLVDTNLATPVHNRLFHLPNRVGVSGLLSTEGDERGAIQPSPIPNLSVLATGPDVPNATELFDRGRLFQKLRPLHDSFDMIVTDASAGDEPAIAACEGVDAVLLTMKKHRSSLTAVRAVSAWLKSRGTLVLGSILTK